MRAVIRRYPLRSGYEQLMDVIIGPAIIHVLVPGDIAYRVTRCGRCAGTSRSIRLYPLGIIVDCVKLVDVVINSSERNDLNRATF